MELKADVFLLLIFPRGHDVDGFLLLTLIRDAVAYNRYLLFDEQERKDMNDLNWRYGFYSKYHNECWVQIEKMGPNGPVPERDKPGYRYRDLWCVRLVEPDRSWMFECPCGHVLWFHRWKRHVVTKKLGVNVVICPECDCVLGVGSYKWINNWLGIFP